MNLSMLRALLVAAVLASASPAGAASALAVLAPEIAHGLGPLPARMIVVASPLVSDEPAPRGDELAVRIASLVAGQMGDRARAHPQRESFAVARALASKGGALVYVQVEIARGQLRASADLYPVLSNGWDRLRMPLPAPSAHAFASAPVDGEIRGYLPALSLDHTRVQKGSHDFGDVLAVSCGDVDGDGVNDLVIVGRAAVAWGRLSSGKFVAKHAVAWTALGPLAPVPLRESLATAAVVPRRDGTGSDLFAGTTDRGGVSLSRDLRGAAPLYGLPVLAAGAVTCARPSPATSSFEGNLFDCEDPARAPTRLPTPRYDAVAVAEIVGRDGHAQVLAAAREPSGTLKLRLGERSESLGPVGAQIAVGDLDEDGVAEVATTADAGADAITISSWRADGLVARARIAVPAAVRALAMCPPDGAGAAPLVSVVGGEVWVVR